MHTFDMVLQSLLHWCTFPSFWHQLRDLDLTRSRLAMKLLSDFFFFVNPMYRCVNRDNNNATNQPNVEGLSASIYRYALLTLSPGSKKFTLRLKDS